MFRATITAVVAASSLAATPAHADNDEEVWKMVNAKIATFLKGTDPNYDQKYLIQLPAGPLYANWINADGTTNKFGVYSLFDVADNVPVWGPTYSGGARKFSEAYGIMVSALNIGNAGAGDATLLAKWQTAQRRYLARLEKAKTDWAVYDKRQKRNAKPADWISKNAWYSTYANADLSALKGVMDTANQAYRKTLSPAQLQYANMINAYYNAQPVTIVSPSSDYQWNMDPTDPATWRTEDRYAFAASPAQLKAIVDTGKAQFAAGSPFMTWELNKNSEVRDEERKSWSASASYGFYFSGSASGSRHSINLSTDGTYIKYSFYGIGIVPISVGPWYSATLQKQFECGPFAPPPSGAPAVTPTSLWGEKGLMGARPTALVVVYKPQIQAKLTQSDYNFVRSEFSVSGRVGIGPFGGGGGFSEVKQHSDFHDDTGTFTITTVSETPQIIAILYEKQGRVDCP